MGHMQVDRIIGAGLIGVLPPIIQILCNIFGIFIATAIGFHLAGDFNPGDGHLRTKLGGAFEAIGQ